MEPQYLKVKDTEHDKWSNQKLLHHLQHAKTQLNLLIYSKDKADLEPQDLKGHSHI